MENAEAKKSRVKATFARIPAHMRALAQRCAEAREAEVMREHSKLTVGEVLPLALDAYVETLEGFTMPEPKPVQWEYKREAIGSYGLKEHEANDLGMDGWEMIGFDANEYAWFKRPRP